MTNSLLIVFLKELKEVLRDRKTLVFMLLLPTVAVPLLINAMLSFIVRMHEKAATEIIPYAIIGAQNLPELADRFEANDGFKSFFVASEEALPDAIDQKTIKLGVVIPDDASETLAENGQTKITLYYNNASATRSVRKRAGDVIEAFSHDQRAARLEEMGLSADQQVPLIQPVTIKDHGTADMREVMGEQLGGMLPYLFILFCFLGALYPAIDLAAGEKERGTLETLLLTPVPRSNLVLGKFLVIFSTGFTAAILSLLALGVWIAFKGRAVTGILGEVLGSVSTSDLLLVAAMLIPIAAMFAAVLLSISIYAKSFKEAQSYATPINFLVIIPAFVGLLPGVELNWTFAMFPIANASLAIKELVKGTIDYSMLFVIFSSSIVIAAALLLFCAKWFERESVLFRE